MTQEIEIQTNDELKIIDYRKETNEIINEKLNQTENISAQLDTIQTSIDNIDNSGNVDLSEVTDMIENIDTTIVEVQTQDILTIVNQQQEQINNINDKLDMILKKL